MLQKNTPTPALVGVLDITFTPNNIISLVASSFPGSKNVTYLETPLFINFTPNWKSDSAATDPFQYPPDAIIIYNNIMIFIYTYVNNRS